MSVTASMPVEVPAATLDDPTAKANAEAAIAADVSVFNQIN